MFGLDETIADLGQGGGLLAALAIALLLGLRHATDPDHLTAVSTLVMSEDERGPRRAAGLGLAWGLGHGVTLLALGLPIVLFDRYLPDWAQRGLEVAIGLVIVALAVRLLVRWRRGFLHVHVHSHGGTVHAHPHMHEGGRHEAHPHEHRHRHAEGLGRTPLASFGIGLVHGAGGSAGVGVLLVAAAPGTVAGVSALAALAAGTALSMAAVSSAFGYALARGPVERGFALMAPGFGTLSLMFGVWYALGALEAVPYVL